MLWSGIKSSLQYSPAQSHGSGSGERSSIQLACVCPLHGLHCRWQPIRLSTPSSCLHPTLACSIIHSTTHISILFKMLLFMVQHTPSLLTFILAPFLNTFHIVLASATIMPSCNPLLIIPCLCSCVLCSAVELHNAYVSTNTWIKPPWNICDFRKNFLSAPKESHPTFWSFLLRYLIIFISRLTYKNKPGFPELFHQST